ncbi:MAG: hypothetical protein ACKV2T_06885 [Kofleriaceae bacterium]
MEFLERIEFGYDAVLWRVRVDGGIGTAHVFRELDVRFYDQIARRTKPWIGFRHPRVVPVLSASTVTPRFVIVTGDDRGPSITRAATQLADAGLDERDREAWAVGEIAGIADAITAMAVYAGETVEDPGTHDGGRSRPFVHRRANPEQIVVGVDGRAKLRAPIEQGSVGIAPNYLGRGPAITGLAWMSPEIVRGEHALPSSDVFQLATTLYTMLTGQRLAHGNGDFEMLRAIIDRTEPPALQTITPGLVDVVQRGVARVQDERYPDPAAFARALRSLSVGEPPAAVFDIAGRQPHPAPSRSAVVTSGRCQLAWEQLSATGVEGIRHCATCQQEVVRVSSVLALIPLLGNRCVAFQTDDN